MANAVLHKQQMFCWKLGPLNSGMRSSKPPTYLRKITAMRECLVHPHWDTEPDALPWFYLDHVYSSPHGDAGPVFLPHGFHSTATSAQMLSHCAELCLLGASFLPRPSVHLCYLLLVWIAASQADIHLLCVPNCRWCFVYLHISVWNVKSGCSALGFSSLEIQLSGIPALWDTLLSFPSVQPPTPCLGDLCQKLKYMEALLFGRTKTEMLPNLKSCIEEKRR